MSDTTNFMLVFAAIPEAEIPAATAVVNEYGLSESWDLWPPDGGFEAVAPGVMYTSGNARTDIVDEMVPTLVEAAPGAMFYCHTDPAYEYLGSLYLRVPGMDDFQSECDADGNAVVDPESIRAILDQLPDDMTVAEARGAVDDKVRRASGKLWWDVIHGRLKELPAWNN
jgi:hypothetical protein